MATARTLPGPEAKKVPRGTGNMLLASKNTRIEDELLGVLEYPITTSPCIDVHLAGVCQHYGISKDTLRPHYQYNAMVQQGSVTVPQHFTFSIAVGRGSDIARITRHAHRNTNNTYIAGCRGAGPTDTVRHLAADISTVCYAAAAGRRSPQERGVCVFQGHGVVQGESAEQSLLHSLRGGHRQHQSVVLQHSEHIETCRKRGMSPLTISVYQTMSSTHGARQGRGAAPPRTFDWGKETNHLAMQPTYHQNRKARRIWVTLF